MMIVTPRPLLVVVRPGSFTLPQREECHLIDDVTHRLVTGESEPNDPLLAAPDCHGHSAGVPLEVLKRFPPPGGVPQEGPERRGGNPVLTDRQRPDPLPLPPARAKSVECLPILADR